MEKLKAIAEELTYYQWFLLRIGKEGFNQGIFQAAFFHRILVDDDAMMRQKTSSTTSWSRLTEMKKMKAKMKVVVTPRQMRRSNNFWKGCSTFYKYLNLPLGRGCGP